ncbi:MAG: STAS domain-containing protein [Chloroflexi bacterium]|nr:STAS domain-containing protein [Chloroflexota bacterium]MCH8337958.1 STAS domain-containing protein [Chloroflexota bacterium]MCH8341014.1 STAS domain-containing protein [Chloroflexota bacterium]
MTEAKVTMEVRSADSATLAGSVSIIDVQGEITSFAENVLMDAYTQATSEGADVIILNFEGLEYMNSGGIGLLVTLLIRANRKDQTLLAYGLTEHYQQIFELTRLNEAIKIYGTEAEALATVSEAA